MNRYVILVVYLAATCYVVVHGQTSLVEVEHPKRCVMQRVSKLLGYTCTNMNLKEVPQFLKSSMQILDLSCNRIRDLSPQSFQQYDAIKYLYIFDNMLQTIEPNTFALLQELEAIDLSTNGLTTIPNELFDLPLLRNLYINDNDLKTLSADLTYINKPIVAPLQLLSMSKCKLSAIPDFGPLPNLHTLNVSSNALADVSPEMLSPFCTMQHIAINDTQIEMCMCYKVAQYLRNRRIVMTGGIHCEMASVTQKETYCTDAMNGTSETPAYGDCLKLVLLKKVHEDTKVMWMSIALGIAAFFVVFTGLLYLLHRRSKRKQRQLHEVRTLQRIHSEFSNTDELLCGAVDEKTEAL